MKAIETRYKGYRFRSRLEARWAVFFDALGYAWEYEPEGFDLGNAGWYLPDFRLGGEDNNGDFNIFYFEVKSDLDNISPKEAAKIEAFKKFLWDSVDGQSISRPTKGYGDFIVLDGPPEVRIYDGTFDTWYMYGPRDRPYFTGDGDGDADGWALRYLSDIGVIDALRSACNKAKSARFEHGECGATV